MAQGTSYATILLLSLCIAVCTVGQELEIEGSNSAPDFFDLESEFEGIDNVYGEPYEETEENEEPDEQEEVAVADEQEEVVVDDEPEIIEPSEEPAEAEEADGPEEVIEADEPEVVVEANEPEVVEEADEPEVAEEAEEPEDDDDVSVRVTEEGFPSCSTFDETAQALFLPEHVLWSVGLEDATSCCEICEAYLECRMWTMDRIDLLCTLLVTDEVETSRNAEWATGYKEL